MARLVVHTATGPKKIEGKDGDVFICQCGLSTNKPFCSGAHKTIQSEAEDELMAYDEDGSPLEFEGGHEHKHHHECEDCGDKKHGHKKDSCCGGDEGCHCC